MSIRDRVEQALNPLLGLALIKLGRAANMGCFEFGDALRQSASKGIVKIKPQYVIHAQCSWRLIGREGIIVGSRDIYYPAGDPFKRPPNFDWDLPGANRFDERTKKFFKETRTLLVIEKIDADSTGAVNISMRGGYRLEIFPDDSADTEHWRLLGPGAQPEHFVIRGGKIED